MFWKHVRYATYETKGMSGRVLSLGGWSICCFYERRWRKEIRIKLGGRKLRLFFPPPPTKVFGLWPTKIGWRLSGFFFSWRLILLRFDKKKGWCASRFLVTWEENQSNLEILESSHKKRQRERGWFTFFYFQCCHTLGENSPDWRFLRPPAEISGRLYGNTAGIVTIDGGIKWC